MWRGWSTRETLGVLGNIDGVDAAVATQAAALAKAQSAAAVILVEGTSDQVALETLADRRAYNLAARRIAIVSMRGAHAIGRHLGYFAGQRSAIAIVGLCDEAEEELFRRAVANAGRGNPRTRDGLEQCGFFVCVKDLEEELIRAVDRSTIEEVLESRGDLGSFRTLQKQPEWRGRAFDLQFHRWLRASSRRSGRYAQLLVLAADADRIPHPLDGVLNAARSSR